MLVKIIKVSRSWILAFILLIVGLLVLEIILRSFIYKIPENAINDTNYGYTPAKGTYLFQSVEGYGITHYVADGEIATPYTAGVSVVVFGDSFTEAYQVNDDEKYPSVAEKLLWDRGVKVDLHNLGSSGSRIPDFIYQFNKIKDQYQPKIVVLQVNYDSFISNQYFNPKLNNYIIILPDGSLQIQHKPFAIRSVPYWLTYVNRHTSIIGYGYRRFGEIKQKILNKYSPPDNIDKPLNKPELLKDDELIQAKISMIKSTFTGTKLIIILTPPFPYFDQNKLILDQYLRQL